MTPVSQIVTNVQSFLNDSQSDTFSFDAIKPYINIALGELRELMESANISMTNETMTGLIVTAGVTEVPLSSLPNDFVEFRRISERTQGTSEVFISMRRVEFIPGGLTPITNLVFWAWENQKLKFVGATSNIELQIDYTASKLPNINSQIDTIPLINSELFISYRTAGLASQYIGENQDRADRLNANAESALDRFMRINIKPKQSVWTRRRPLFPRGNYGGY